MVKKSKKTKKDENEGLILFSGEQEIKIEPQAGKYIFKYYNRDRQGGTRTKGWVNVIDLGNSIEIRLELRVRKSGYTGTGKGALGFQLLDGQFDPMIQQSQGLTVGARAPEGVHEKKWKKVYALTGAYAERIRSEGLILAASISTEYDNIGLPRNIAEWKKIIADVAPILAMSNGGVFEKAGWYFMKVIK